MGGRAATVSDDRLSVHLESEAFSCDNLRILELSGSERISEMFRFDLKLSCSDPEGLADDVAGARVALSFRRGEREVRRIHGLVAKVNDLLETEADHRTYRIRIVPRMWRLSLIETLDVFLDESVPDLVQRKLELVGAASENHLAGSYAVRELMVQYQETDHAFVSRRLEHLGISYVFRHNVDEERVLLIDTAAGFPALGDDAGDLEVHYVGRGEKTGVYAIERETDLIPQGYVVRDYNYRTPSLEVMGMYESDVGYAGGNVEYGNHTKTPDEATHLAKVRAEEREAAQRVYRGESSVVALTAGHRFALSGHKHIDEPLLLVSVKHEMKQPGMMSGGDAAPGSYRNTFEAMPAERTYRPARTTPIPRIHGVTTGIIDTPDGAPGKLPAMDEQGRYTVRFLFDTAAPDERRASHPVRLAQLFSGANYGSHFPLRPGVEVILTFIDGDPDRPIITGAMPNPETATPVTGREPLTSRIRTESGIEIEFTDL